MPFQKKSRHNHLEILIDDREAERWERIAEAEQETQRLLWNECLESHLFPFDDAKLFGTDSEIGGYVDVEGRLQTLRQFTVGNTPLREVDGSTYKIQKLFVKDECRNQLDGSGNPFGTFKDRKARYIAKMLAPTNEFYAAAMTSGNFGYSLAVMLRAIDIKTILLVPTDMDTKKIQVLGRNAIIVPLEFENRFYDSDNFEKIAAKAARVPPECVIDVTNFVISPYDAIFTELDWQLRKRNETLDYLVLVGGGMELFMAGLLHYMNGGAVGGKKKIVCVTTDNPDSVAEMLYAKYRPVLFQPHDGGFIIEGGKCTQEQALWIKEYTQGFHGNFRVVSVDDSDILEAYAWYQNVSKDTGSSAEPSAAAAFAGLKRIRPKPYETVVVINTGDGRKNFV